MLVTYPSENQNEKGKKMLFSFDGDIKHVGTNDSVKSVPSFGVLLDCRKTRSLIFIRVTFLEGFRKDKWFIPTEIDINRHRVTDTGGEYLYRHPIHGFHL